MKSRTWLRLAALLGISVRMAQAKIDFREFAEWQAFLNWKAEQ